MSDIRCLPHVLRDEPKGDRFDVALVRFRLAAVSENVGADLYAHPLLVEGIVEHGLRECSTFRRALAWDGFTQAFGAFVIKPIAHLRAACRRPEVRKAEVMPDVFQGLNLFEKSEPLQFGVKRYIPN